MRSFVGWSLTCPLHPPALGNGGDGNGGSEPFGTGGDTSNLGFQLTQLSRWEGRRWNSKVERSAQTVLLNNVGTRKRRKREPAAQLLGTNVYGVENVKNHESKAEDWSNSL